MTRFVVDASVGVKWCLPDRGEEFVAQSLGLLRDFRQGEIGFLVPDLFWIELASALWKAVRRKRVSLQRAQSAFSRAQEFEIPTVATAPLLPDALQLAANHERTVYDSIYVVLAVQLGAELITADERLANAVAAYLPVKWLGAI